MLGNYLECAQIRSRINILLANDLHLELPPILSTGFSYQSPYMVNIISILMLLDLIALKVIINSFFVVYDGMSLCYIVHDIFIFFIYLIT